MPQDAIDLYESILQHHMGEQGDGGAAEGIGGGSGGGAEEGGGSLLSVPPAALANLCVAYVIGSQNEVGCC